MVRLRSVRRFSVRVPDALHVSSFRTFCLAQSRAQRSPGISLQSLVTHRRAVRSHALFVDAGDLLPGLLDHGDRSELVRILDAVDGAAVLAGWTALVSVANIAARHRRGSAVSVYASRGRIPRPAVDKRRRISRA